MGRNKTEPKPLIEINPKSLIAEKHKYYLGVDNRMCKEYCHLIDSVAASWGWNLDKEEWTHTDGRRFQGLVEQKFPCKTLEQARKDHEGCKTVFSENTKDGVLLVIVLIQDGVSPRFRCLRYVHVNRAEGYVAHVDFKDTDCRVDLIWLSTQMKQK